ncbi:MAG: DNA repair protein RadA [Patescibacteria group bacterium]
MKDVRIHICSKCDAQYPKWTGRCSECGAWGTIAESQIRKPFLKKKQNVVSGAPAQVTRLQDTSSAAIERLSATQFPAAKVFAGGLARGSLTLMTGEPGAGKSTLCLQLAHNFSGHLKVLYVTSEESVAQVRERAARMGSFGESFLLAESFDLGTILATIRTERPDVVVIDSLQTVTASEVESDAGSIQQIRTVSAQLREAAKRENTAIILIGHVTKDGALAGPKSLEHLVDAVYYLETDTKRPYRLLRSYKNRFGESGKVLVLQLTGKGMIEVANAATIFIQNYEPKPGSVITVTLLDDQIFFLEVQALVSKSAFGYAKRTSSGFSRSRLEMLLAIVKKHLHVDTDAYDVYVNIAGGFHVNEPAMDLAVVVALLSSIKEAALPGNTVVFGEVGLSGELRIVKDTAMRLTESAKNKFSIVYLPPLEKKVSSTLQLKCNSTLSELVAALAW